MDVERGCAEQKPFKQILVVRRGCRERMDCPLDWGDAEGDEEPLGRCDVVANKARACTEAMVDWALNLCIYAQEQ